MQQRGARAHSTETLSRSQIQIRVRKARTTSEVAATEIKTGLAFLKRARRQIVQLSPQEVAPDDYSILIDLAREIDAACEASIQILDPKRKKAARPQ